MPVMRPALVAMTVSKEDKERAYTAVPSRDTDRHRQRVNTEGTTPDTEEEGDIATKDPQCPHWCMTPKCPRQAAAIFSVCVLFAIFCLVYYNYM